VLPYQALHLPTYFNFPQQKKNLFTLIPIERPLVETHFKRQQFNKEQKTKQKMSQEESNSGF
jgi:hypothetical protein